MGLKLSAIWLIITSKEYFVINGHGKLRASLNGKEKNPVKECIEKYYLRRHDEAEGG